MYQVLVVSNVKNIFEVVQHELHVQRDLFYQTNLSFATCTSLVETSYSNRCARKRIDYRVAQANIDMFFRDAYF